MFFTIKTIGASIIIKRVIGGVTMTKNELKKELINLCDKVLDKKDINDIIKFIKNTYKQGN